MKCIIKLLKLYLQTKTRHNNQFFQHIFKGLITIYVHGTSQIISKLNFKGLKRRNLNTEKKKKLN